MTAATAARAGVSPVAADVRVVSARGDDGRAATQVLVSPAEPVFAGHYPEFPIFPGVCVVECAHRSAQATAPEPVELAAVESARFTGPAFPGDVLDLALKWRRTEGGWLCAVSAATARGGAASVRLRYRTAADRNRPGGPGTEPGVRVPGTSWSDGAVPEAELPEVLSLLPHRYPMLLVDRIATLVPGVRITGVKSVTHNEPWYAHLAPGQDPAYPSSLLIESWGQTAGLLASAAAPDISGQVMLFGSVAQAEFHRPVLPGDVVEHHISVSRSLGDSVIFEGRAGAAPAW